jgi:hypothetical protein
MAFAVELIWKKKDIIWYYVQVYYIDTSLLNKDGLMSRLADKRNK